MRFREWKISYFLEFVRIQFLERKKWRNFARIKFHEQLEKKKILTFKIFISFWAAMKIIFLSAMVHFVSTLFMFVSLKPTKKMGNLPMEISRSFKFFVRYKCSFKAKLTSTHYHRGFFRKRWTWNFMWSNNKIN